MRRRLVPLSIGLVAAGCTLAGPAWTQEPLSSERPLPAPTHAFELQIASGFTQGFGAIAPGQRVPDVAGPGVALDVNGAWRMGEYASLDVQGEYDEFASARNVAARGVVGNAGLTLHASPLTHGDPWARIATGYRMLWSVSPPGAPNTLLHGFELARLTIGYDVRVTPDIALAPVAGADLNLFLWQVQGGYNTMMSSGQLGTFFFTGVQGRFDLGGFASGRGVANGW